MVVLLIEAHAASQSSGVGKCLKPHSMLGVSARHDTDSDQVASIGKGTGEPAGSEEPVLSDSFMHWPPVPAMLCPELLRSCCCMTEDRLVRLMADPPVSF